jgi:hypothetical protein
MELPTDHSMLASLKHAFDTARAALGMIKDIRDVIPEGYDKSAVSQKLAEAERTMALAEAQIAQGLGYPLCKCDWPPAIMLSKGYHPRHVEEVFKCPRWGAQQPPEEEFARRDRFALAGPRRIKGMV